MDSAPNLFQSELKDSGEIIKEPTINPVITYDYIKNISKINLIPRLGKKCGLDGIGIKRIGVIRKRIGIGIFMIHIRFLLTGTEYFKMVFLFVLTESEYFILVFLLKENEFNVLTELFV